MPNLVSYQRQYREHYWNMVTLDEENVASAVCMFSRPGMPVRKLGHFRAELGAKHPLSIRLASLITAHKLNEKPVTNVPAGPGSRLVRITVRDGGKWVANSHPSLAPLPAPLDTVEEVMLSLFAEAAKSPLRSLAFNAEMNVRRLRPGGDLSIQLSVTNGGRLTAKFLNPASGAASVSFLVWLAGQRQDPARESGYVATIETKGKEFLKAPHEALPSDVEKLQLGAGERVEASVQFRVPKLDRGAFQLQLLYNGMAAVGDDSDLIIGGYHGDPIDFRID